MTYGRISMMSLLTPPQMADTPSAIAADHECCLQEQSCMLAVLPQCSPTGLIEFDNGIDMDASASA
jgi:hypothetical protein